MFRTCDQNGGHIKLAPYRNPKPTHGEVTGGARRRRLPTPLAELRRGGASPSTPCWEVGAVRAELMHPSFACVREPASRRMRNAETYMLEVNGVRFIGEQVRAGAPRVLCAGVAR